MGEIRERRVCMGWGGRIQEFQVPPSVSLYGAMAARSPAVPPVLLLPAPSPAVCPLLPHSLRAAGTSDYFRVLSSSSARRSAEPCRFATSFPLSLLFLMTTCEFSNDRIPYSHWVMVFVFSCVCEWP